MLCCTDNNYKNKENIGKVNFSSSLKLNVVYDDKKKNKKTSFLLPTVDEKPEDNTPISKAISSISENPLSDSVKI